MFKTSSPVGYRGWVSHANRDLVSFYCSRAFAMLSFFSTSLLGPKSQEGLNGRIDRQPASLHCHHEASDARQKHADTY